VAAALRMLADFDWIGVRQIKTEGRTATQYREPEGAVMDYLLMLKAAEPENEPTITTAKTAKSPFGSKGSSLGGMFLQMATRPEHLSHRATELLARNERRRVV
jgi:hypothetical protein